MLCQSCGGEVTSGAKFCQSCGTPVSATVNPEEPSPKIEQARTPTGEPIFWQGYVKAKISRSEFKGPRSKLAGFLAGGLVGYALAGRDKKTETSTAGQLLVAGSRFTLSEQLYFPGYAFESKDIFLATMQGPGRVLISLAPPDASPGRGVWTQMEATTDSNQAPILCAGLMQSKKTALSGSGNPVIGRSSGATRFCTSCGAELHASATFCRLCGKDAPLIS